MHKTDLSMVQFNTIFKRNDSLYLNPRYFFYENIIRQPILSYIFYYNETTGKGDELNTALWDKLIKREIALKTVNFIGLDYYNQRIKKENDVILLFSLFQIADSYQYINETGYLYMADNDDSITRSWQKKYIMNQIVHGLFVNIDFLYEKTKNSYFDKLFCIFKLKQSFIRYYISFATSHKEFLFMKKILLKLLKSPYIINKEKIIIKYIDSFISLIYLIRKE